MCDLAALFSSSIGRKIIMAITGLLLIGFVVAHLLGNLQMFLGPEKMNAYASYLQSLGPLLWVARIFLILAFATHIVTAISVSKDQQKARPKDYHYQNSVQLSFAARYMLHSGAIILIFLVIHLLHFTLGYLQPDTFHILDSKGRHDVYSVVVHGFLNPIYFFVYVISMIFLGFHLSHAIQSAFQTLGILNSKWRSPVKRVSQIFSLLIALGFISIPVAVVMHLITLPS